MAEGNGFGLPVIGRGVRGLMPFGHPGIGKKEGEVGSGIQGIGNIDEKKTVRSFNLTNQNINSKDF